MAKAKVNKTKAEKKSGKSHNSLKKKRVSILTAIQRAIYWVLLISIWSGIGIAGLFAFYGFQLPNAEHWEIPHRQSNARILDANGNLITQRGAGGQAIPLSEMSHYIPQAVIAIEDRRFHKHFGFDIFGFARAMIINIATQSFRQGGSTITQQLAKNLFLKPERTLKRKVQELILAFWIEYNYAKSEILELYLNRVYLGGGAWGIDAASQLYYQKSPVELDLYESAVLAGLLRAPSYYNPVRHPQRADERAKIVMDAMKREGYIDKHKNAGIKALITPKSYREGGEHYAVDMIMKRVRELLGAVEYDIEIVTTLLPHTMNVAQKTIDTYDKAGDQAALVAMSPDGAIRALIGGRNYTNSTFNRAINAQRQPGSAFKPFIWLAAMEQGLKPETIMLDIPVNINGWTPQNYKREFIGPVTLKQALANSLNTIAAQLIDKVGINNVIAVAKRLGIRSKLANNYSLALGTSETSPMELTRAYATFANGGFEVEPYLIQQIKDANGKIIFQRGPFRGERIIDPQTVGTMNGLLYNTVQQGTGKSAKLKNHIVAGKTGTTQNWRDAWFVGYTSHMVTAVWFGNDNNESMGKNAGGALAARAFHDFMEESHQELQTDILPGNGFISFLFNK